MGKKKSAMIPIFPVVANGTGEPSTETWGTGETTNCKAVRSSVLAVLRWAHLQNSQREIFSRQQDM